MNQLFPCKNDINHKCMSDEDETDGGIISLILSYCVLKSRDTSKCVKMDSSQEYIIKNSDLSCSKLSSRDCLTTENCISSTSNENFFQTLPKISNSDNKLILIFNYLDDSIYCGKKCCSDSGC